MRVKEKFNRKLLVEGNDDQHVIWALCEKFAIEETFDVIDCEGIDNLLNQIPVRIKQSGIEAIGVIIDADNNLASRWHSLSLLLTSLNYDTPEILPKDGLILQHGNITIGVWIMPDNSVNGMIEDFMKFLIPQNDDLLNIADSSLNQIELDGLNKYKLIHKSKAFIHTWLSWQEDPGTPMGSSITKRYLSTDSPICNVFIEWLKKVLN